jgi:hypothetical protein
LIFLTKNDFKFKEVEYRSRLFLFLCLIFTVGSSWTIGKYTNALQTLLSPTGFFVTGGMFFNFDFYFVFALAASREFLAETQIIMVLKGLISAQRSVSLSILMFYINSAWSKNAYNFFFKYSCYFLIAFSLSFFTFYRADWVRGSATNINTGPSSSFSKSFEAEAEVLKSFQVSKGLINSIVSRISFLELAMLPVMFKDQNIKNISIFYDKYSIVNQLKLIINNIVPGDIFKFDVYPCQYYRAAFTETPIAFVREHYTSINMTLPVYFYMYSNFYVSILLSGLTIWGYYLLTLRAFRVHPLAGAVFIYVFYTSFLYYFDWVMIVKPIVVGMISLIFFILISNLHDKMIRLLKHKT